MFLILSLLLSVSSQAADDCFSRRMDCYLDAHLVCGPIKNGDTSCSSKILASCDRTFHCEGTLPDTAGAKLNPGFKFRSNVELDSSCNPYRQMLEQRIEAAVGRLQECVNYAFVREDIAKRMAAVLAPTQGARIHCQEPPRTSWCAAAGYGDIWLSPSRMLSPQGICYPDMGAMIIHEISHVAGLRMSGEHNEMGETNLPDEVYGLQNYCFRSARMWIKRSVHTAEIVDSNHLSCIREYQEYTPSTDRDPFWGEYRDRMDRGIDPCPASLDPALNQRVKSGRRGD